MGRKIYCEVKDTWKKNMDLEHLFYGGDTDAEFIYGVDAVKSDTDNRFHELMEAAI